METAKRKMAGMGAVRHCADGGFISKLFGSSKPAETVTEKFARQDAERAAKAKPAASAAAQRSSNAISNYADMGVIQRREKEAGMKDGGAIKGPGTGTSDDVPIMASHGEFMIKAAAVKKIGVPALEALNAIADKPGGAIKKMHKAGHMFQGGPVDEEFRLAQLQGNTLPEAFANSTQQGMGVPPAAPAPQVAQNTPAPTVAAGAIPFQSNIANMVRATREADKGITGATGGMTGPQPVMAPAVAAPPASALTVPAGAIPFKSDAAAMFRATRESDKNIKGVIGQAAERVAAAPPQAAPEQASAPTQSGGAVFGLYPQLAGGKRTTYATDAKLKAGVVATGPATFEPALTPAPKAIVGGGSGVRLGAIQDPRSAIAAPEVLAAAQAAAPGASASPVAVSSAGDATMPGQDPNRITLNGRSGADVAGAPGVSKFAQNGKTLYSNVPGDNQSTGAVNTVPGMAQASIDQALTNPDGSRWSAQDNAVMAANLRDGIDPYRGTSRQQASAPEAFDPSSAVRRLNDASDPGRRSGESGRGARGRAQGAISQMADLQSEVLGGSRQLANAQMADATTRRSQDQAAVAQGAVRKLAQDRLTLDATKAGQDAKGASLDNESKAGVLAAQKALAAAKTPAERLAAEDNLRALQGKYGKEPAPVRHLVVPGGQAMDANGQAYTMPSRVFNPDTQQFIDQAPAQAKAQIAEGSISTVNGKSAKYIGGKWVPQ